MFTVVLLMKDICKTDNFVEAFVCFYDGIAKLIEKDVPTHHYHNACWIDCRTTPLFLGQVAQIGQVLELVNENGRLVENPEEVFATTVKKLSPAGFPKELERFISQIIESANAA